MKKINVKRIIVVAVFLLLYTLSLVLFSKDKSMNLITEESLMIYENATVVKVLSETADTQSWTEDRRIGSQEVILRIDSGKFKGTELKSYNNINAYTNIDLCEGTKIIVRLSLDYDRSPVVYMITSYDRIPVILGLVFVFVFLIIILGGKKGVAAILGLIFTIISIWFLLIPLLIKGIEPIIATIVLVAVTTAVSLISLNGFSKKTLVSTMACIGGVAIAGTTAYITGLITPINGFNMTGAGSIISNASAHDVKVSGLLICGILISSLGAVMDVAMTITSAVFEIKQLNPQSDMKTLFKSGMNIGKDAMGTMANTLILAFAGASINTLVMFRVLNFSALYAFNTDMVFIEVIQGISGSIGIVLTVPLVAILSAIFCTEFKHIKRFAKLPWRTH